MKKSGTLFVLISAIVAVFLVGIVSAAGPLTQMVTDFFNGLVEILKPYLEAILGQVAPVAGADVGNIFLAKLVLAIVLVALVYYTLSLVETFKSKPWILWILSLGVSILGVRFLDAETVKTIILSNSVFAVAVTAGLPFVLFFLFVEKGLKAPDHAPIVRKVAWIFYTVVFLILYSMRADELGQIGLIYPITAGVAFIMALFDGTIQGFFLRSRIQRMSAGYKGSGAAAIQNKMTKATENWNSNPTGYIGVTTKGSGKTGTEAYLADLEELEENLTKLLAK